jgi:phenylpropionate dioxygenase-like ring-hydroxylating dioxygenase large terminal subunit
MSNNFLVDSQDYFDEEVFDRELNNITNNYWIFLCPSKIVENPNDFFVFKGFERNIVIKRVQSGSVIAFDNYCKHRGHEIHKDYFGNAVTRCQYHGWLYGDDLKLKNLPWNEKCYHLNISEIELDSSVKILECDGIIWGYFGGLKDISKVKYPAGNISDTLNLFLDNSSSSKYIVRSRKKFNWRLIFDNLYDQVHPLFIHRNSLNKSVNLSFTDCANDFNIEGIEAYLESNFAHIGNKVESGNSNFDTESKNMNGEEYLNGHIYPFLHFLTPDGGQTFSYESYIPINASSTLITVFRFVSQKIPKNIHTTILQQYLKGESVVLGEDYSAVESITKNGKSPKKLNYGAYEKCAVGLINLGKNK